MSDRRAASGSKPEGASRRGRRRLRRIAAFTGAGLLGVAILLAGAVTWLVATPSGLRFAVDQLRPYLPESVAFDSVEGRLVGPLTLRGLRVRAEGATVRVERAGLDWAPAALLSETLRIRYVEVSGVDVALAAPDGGPASGPARLPGPPGDLALPLAVELERLAVDDIRIETAGEVARSIERIRLHGRADDERIALAGIRVEAPEGRIAGDLSLATTAPHAAGGVLEWRLEGAGRRPPFAGRLQLGGTLAELRLQHTLTEPTPVRVRGRLRAFGEAPSWDAEVELAPMRPADWLASAPAGTLGADLRLDGTFSRIRARGDFRVGDVHAGPYTGTLDVTADADGLDVRRLALRREGSDASVRLAGRVGYGGEGGPRFDLVLDWERLQWPLAEPATVASPEGRLALEGRPDDYGLDLRMQVRRPGTDLPAASVTLGGRGSTTALDTLTGHVEWAGAALDLDGRVGWGEQPGARVALDLSGLPMATLSDDRVAGSLDARAVLEAGWGERVTADLRLERVRGTLNGRPLEGEGRLRYDDGAIELPRLRLAAGDARLSASGRLDERVSLDWSVHVPDLHALYAPAEGRLEGSGQVRGRRGAPSLSGELRGEALRWQDLRVGRLDLRARAAAPERIDAAIELALADVVVAGRRIDRLEAGLEGTLAAHRLRVEAAAPEGTAALALAGALDGGDWRGRLAAADLQPADGPAWRLASPTALRYVDGRAELERACFVRDPARVCLSGDGDAGDWRARIDGEAVPYALAGAFGPERLGYAGRFGLQFTLAGGRDPVTGEGRVDLGAGHVSATGDDGPQRLIEWQAGTLEATLGRERLDARLRLPLADGGRVAATLGVGRDERRSLAGRIEARVRDPAIVAELVPQIGSITGDVEADIELGGTATAPQVTGSASLVNGRVGVVPLGIELHELELSADTLGRGIRVRAAATSGEGRLHASLGLQQAADGGLSGEGMIRGEGFRAAALPELGLVVSPDLRWRVDDRRVELEGSIDLPSARIEPRDISGAVHTSPDAVMVAGDDEVVTADGERWRVDARVDVRLGDDVHIDAFGLDARLGGAISVREEPGKLTTATGELRVEEGDYTIYRQKLQIERGRVLFEGGPLIDPGLDVRAVRRPRDVLVGVNVRGTLREPRATLFSEPPMPESQQLSYLIAGVPLGRSSGGDGDAMAAVAGALAGSEKGRELARQIGIDEVTVDRSGDAGAALVLGRYLSPRLYVGYGIGLAEQVNSVRMRYDLTRRWTLEGQSGVTTGADLLYSIETD